MEERTLTEEEVEKLKELKNSAEFQKTYKLMQDEVMKKEKQRRNIAMKGFLCLLVFVLLPRAGFYLSLIMGFAIILIPFYLSKIKGSNLNKIYKEQLLNLILDRVFPEAKIVPSGIAPIEDVQYVVPKSEKYNQFNMLKLKDERNLSVCNMYAWHEEKYGTENKRRTKEVTDFRGILYFLTLSEAVQGHLRVVPTKQSAYTNRETQGGYFGTLEGERKIDVEDIVHNENYNIYCTEEISARKFLSPTILTWFDKHIAEQGLCLYLKGNQLYISQYTNAYLFPVPDMKEKLHLWSVENAALYLKELIQETKDMVAVF